MSAFDDKMRALMEQAWAASESFAWLTDEDAAAQDRDRFPRAMIEATTEYDWAELPDWLKDVMRHAADEFRRWADVEPIAGELANELEAPRG